MGTPIPALGVHIEQPVKIRHPKQPRASDSGALQDAISPPSIDDAH